MWPNPLNFDDRRKFFNLEAWINYYHIRLIYCWSQVERTFNICKHSEFHTWSFRRSRICQAPGCRDTSIFDWVVHFPWVYPLEDKPSSQTGIIYSHNCVGFSYSNFWRSVFLIFHFDFTYWSTRVLANKRVVVDLFLMATKMISTDKCCAFRTLYPVHDSLVSFCRLPQHF